MGAIILVVVVIVMVGIFALQNAMPVSISFLFLHFDASLAVIALLCFLAGMIAGMAVLSLVRMRRPAKKKDEAYRSRAKNE